MSEENISQKAREALRHIRNWVMNNGRTPSVRELMASMNYKSPRSPMLLIKELEDNGFLLKRIDGTYKLVKDLKSDQVITTVSVPLVGSVTCGLPMLAEENIEATSQVSTSLAKPGSKYFLLKAIGDSMNEGGIDEGDLILVKQQYAPDYNGQKVVVLIDDEATVKEYHAKGNIVTLVPRSRNPKHKPIILTTEHQIQGVVVTAIPNKF